VEGLVDAGNVVIVVAHSYGGVSMSNAVQGLNYKERVVQGEKGGVLMVVYMTSFAIPAGTSLMDGVGGVYPRWNVTVRDKQIFYPYTL
jgi:hypothetical protein